MATEMMHKPIQANEEHRVHGNRPKKLPCIQAAELEELLSSLARRIFVLVPNHPSTKMSVNQLRTCSILQHGPRAVSAIGRELGVSPSNVSQIVERMVRIGLVERYETRDDRRLRLIKLTERGTQIMESRKEYRIERAAGALAKLDATQREAILLALQSLIEAAAVASPFREVDSETPNCVTRVVREAELTPVKFVEDALENYINCRV